VHAVVPDGVTISGSYAAPDWSPSTDGKNSHGVSYRYFNAVDQTFYVASDVGKTISFIVHDADVGSHMNHDRVDREAVTNPEVLGLVAKTFKLILHGMNQFDNSSVDLDKYHIDVQSLDVHDATQVSAFVAQFVKAVHPPPHSRLILALPVRGEIHMKFSNTMLTGGKVAGLAFYKDSNIYNTNSVEIVPIVAFASFEAAVINLDSARLSISQTFSEGRVFDGTKVPAVDLIETTSDPRKLSALRGIVRTGVERVMNGMFEVK
jgi:hypothetical protein